MIIIIIIIMIIESLNLPSKSSHARKKKKKKKAITKQVTTNESTVIQRRKPFVCEADTPPAVGLNLPEGRSEELTAMFSDEKGQVSNIQHTALSPRCIHDVNLYS